MLSLAVLIVGAPPSQAATLTRTTLSAAISGSTVTATTLIASSPAAYASATGICARNAAWHNFDFPHSAATLTTRGTTLTKSRTFPAGTYTYWACARVSVERHRRPADVRRRRRVVGATHHALGDDADRKPGGTALPVGDLPGWKQAFVDDFVTPVPAGSFPGPYAVKWTSYHGFRDTFGIAYYDRSAISVQSGMMDLFLHTRSGTPIGAAPVPIVTKVWQRQAFGRFSVRFRSDPLPGYKAAWLLWPESDNWNEGEIDFPEGGLDSTMWGFITA